jgi:microcystin-dependent protein
MAYTSWSVYAGQVPTTDHWNILGENDDYLKGEVDDHEDYLVPVGGIILWSGAEVNIPSGWALCDGTNGTPDLRNRFVVGAGSTYSVGNTGGSSSVILTSNEMPSHTHTQNAHSHTIAGSKDGDDTDDYEPTKGAASADRLRGWYSNGIGSSTAVNQSTGGGGAHENRPPYYALCYIMKL